MKASVFQFQNNEWKNKTCQHKPGEPVQLVLCFASGNMLHESSIYNNISSKFPGATVAICSTAGEIYHDVVLDDSFVATALSFEKTNIETAVVNIADYQSSHDAAKALIAKLPQQNLNYVLVLSDGSLVNGSELAKGLNEAVDNKILITGGLAGDGVNFSKTFVGLNEAPSQGNIAAIGFYGNNIVVNHGTGGGWQTFGLEKEVTNSEGNKLFEIDEKNALDTYKKYLGPEAENLPGAALLFPLSVTLPGSTQPIVRTILSIDNENKSMTFAGDIPVGSKIRFMKANFDMLTAAASSAAHHSQHDKTVQPSFALLVSCVGRKLILGARIDEEVDAVIDFFGNNTSIAGFYSYGEISPFNEETSCCLHNQTMTITSFYETA
jgi:hypothetical protein